MYSDWVLNKAMRMSVSPKIYNNAIWFNVTYKDREYDVRYSTKEKTFSCNCYHYANKTVTGGTLCSHIIACMYEMVRRKWVKLNTLSPLFPVENLEMVGDKLKENSTVKGLGWA